MKFKNTPIPFFKRLFITCLTIISGTVSAQSLVTGDSIKVAIEPEYDKVGGSQRFFFGENYRHLWAAPIKLKVFYLEKEKGGLKILQKGGGMQTKSLRLQDATGQEWVLRTIQKYPESVLPPTLRPTIAATIIQDQISAEHPYAALTVPIMAEALGVPHANPQIVYVPDDPALGQYRKDFANQVFLFEEREPGDEKTDNTDKAQKKLQNDNDNRVDEKLFLRARLLDFLLGDWDRHEDQWRWERNEDKDGILYKPVPRDRDQVYNSASGVFPWLVSRHLLMAKFQTYEDHIRSINRWNLNARNVDRYFLTDLDEQDWKEQIAYVQNKLTDEVITRAIKQMPADIYKLSGPELTRKLIGRRNVLKRQALKYYRFISNTVSIPASDKRDKFEVVPEKDGALTVIVHKIKKDNSEGRVTYQRTFDPHVTKEVRLYGFAGKDIFSVHGEAHSPITVRMIGGDDEDTFTVDSNVHDKGNLLIYDRSDQQNNLPHSYQARIKTSTDSMVNNYNKKNYKYDFLQPLFLASYNKDYGVQLIGNFIYEKHGFRKEPYSFRQSLLVNYGLGTNSLMLNYNGEFKQVFGKTDLVVNFLSKGPNYTSNFFGVGNNSQFINEGTQKIHYYRNIYFFVNPDVRLKHQYNNWTLSAGVTGQYYNGDEDSNNDRFLKAYDQQFPEKKVFKTEVYGGLVGQAILDTRDKRTDPHKGIYWNTTISGMQGINVGNHSYGQILTDFSFYLNPDKDSVFVIANRTGGGTTIGNATYYQQLKLGGNQNLRGFYLWRFTGKSMAYNNLELRLKLLDFASYILPGTLGVVGFNDVGRVWSPGENSSTWHIGYGGGLYFSPAQLILIQAVVGASKEGAYPYISAGFRF